MLATVAAWRVLCVVGVAWVGLWCGVLCCGVGLACGGVVGLDRIGLGCGGLSGWVGLGWVLVVGGFAHGVCMACGDLS